MTTMLSLRRSLALLGFLMAFALAAVAQSAPLFTTADTLRGSLNANRTWWDVLHYDLSLTPNFSNKSISGRTTIAFSSQGGSTMQIDLQQPLVADSVLLNGNPVPFVQQNNILLVQAAGKPQARLGTGRFTLTVVYHGQPIIAKNPPWDGGWIFETDRQGRPWMSVACQGLGASVWYPCKDHQSDEPDEGARLTVSVPEGLMAVANGTLTQTSTSQGVSTFSWVVRNPINTYNLVPYIGHYTRFEDQYMGKKGALACSYWVLDYNMSKAKQQFVQAKSMLQCFEDWLGPYPFYEDGYKLVESPHLGMEHQSAIAYGNNFANGYRGRDLSGTGIGSQWDYILIHESGHEWFGNNISSKDIADMWVHESFTTYTEALYSECLLGKRAGSTYVCGLRKNIRNDAPIIGLYGVNKAGSGD
ncbi:MAG: M1 family peptidase, partial [Bacteroidetes bacterium]